MKVNPIFESKHLLATPSSHVPAASLVTGWRRSRGSLGMFLTMLLVHSLQAGCTDDQPEPGPRDAAPCTTEAGDAGEASMHPVSWRTSAAVLTAEDFYFDWNCVRYHGNPDEMTIGQNPNVLEVRWHENGNQVGISVYFGQNQSYWWVESICIHNESAEHDRICAETPIRLHLPHGYPYEGVDIDITRTAHDASGTIHLSKMRLQRLYPGMDSRNAHTSP